MDRKLQRHRADSLRQHGFLVAVGDDKKKGKGREGKVHKVTRRYILAICGVDTPRPIPIKFGMRVAPRNVINVSNFCNKIFRGFRSTGGQSPRFPLTLLVIVTTGLRGSAACDIYCVGGDVKHCLIQSIQLGLSGSVN